MSLTRRQVLSGTVIFGLLSISGFKFNRFNERIYVTSVVRSVYPGIRIEESDLNDFASDFIRIYNFDFVTISNKLRYFMLEKSAIISNRYLSKRLFIRYPAQRFFRELVITVFIKSTNFPDVGEAGIVEYFGIQEFNILGVCSNSFARFDLN